MSQLAFRVVFPDEEDQVSTVPIPVAAGGRLDPSRITLSDFFREYAWPQIFLPRDRSSRTRADYVTSLGLWERIARSPRLTQITRETCAEFVCRLRELPGQQPNGRLSPTTVFKHWVNVQRLLDLTGPPSRDDPDRAGLLSDPPWIGRLRRQKPEPKPAFSLEQIFQWLEVLPRMARSCPRNAAFDPAQWWRALILLGYNTGARSGTLFRLRWEWLAGHVLRVPPSAIKGTAGRLLYLNTAALSALEPLRRPAGLILGWADWPAAETTLKKHRCRQLAAAGVAMLPLLALRRSFSTQCGMINPLACQIMMGHVGLGFRMMADHYIDAETLLSEALERLPQPGRPVQGKLF